MNKCEQCGKPIDGFHVVLAYDTGDQQFCDNECLGLHIEARRFGIMNKRDLKADREICNKATPGPWGHRWNPDFSEIYAPGVDEPIILTGHNPHDADFIVQAREGWPYAIERALEAEALVNELKSDSKTDDAVMEGQAKRIEELKTLVRELAKEQARYLRRKNNVK